MALNRSDCKSTGEASPRGFYEVMLRVKGDCSDYLILLSEHRRSLAHMGWVRVKDGCSIYHRASRSAASRAHRLPTRSLL